MNEPLMVASWLLEVHQPARSAALSSRMVPVALSRYCMGDFTMTLDTSASLGSKSLTGLKGLARERSTSCAVPSCARPARGWVRLPVCGMQCADEVAECEARCLIPGIGGATFTLERKAALWARFFTAAPARQGPSSATGHGVVALITSAGVTLRAH